MARYQLTWSDPYGEKDDREPLCRTGKELTWDLFARVACATLLCLLEALVGICRHRVLRDKELSETLSVCSNLDQSPNETQRNPNPLKNVCHGTPQRARSISVLTLARNHCLNFVSCAVPLSLGRGLRH